MKKGHWPLASLTTQNGILVKPLYLQLAKPPFTTSHTTSFLATTIAHFLKIFYLPDADRSVTRQPRRLQAWFFHCRTLLQPDSTALFIYQLQTSHPSHLGITLVQFGRNLFRFAHHICGASEDLFTDVVNLFQILEKRKHSHSCRILHRIGNLIAHCVNLVCT